MKTALVLFALVAASTAFKIPNIGRGELAKELQDFADIIPEEEILGVTLQYLSEDVEFQKMIMYLQSAEFKELVRDVEALREIKTLMDYVHHAGVDIYYLVNILNDFIGLPRLTAPETFRIGEQITGGINGYFKDIEALIPVEEIKALYKKKLAESEVFRNFIAQLSSENFQNIVNKVYANQKFQTLLQHAKKAGVDLERIKDLLKKILNIDVPYNASQMFQTLIEANCSEEKLRQVLEQQSFLFRSSVKLLVGLLLCQLNNDFLHFRGLQHLDKIRKAFGIVGLELVDEPDEGWRGLHLLYVDSDVVVIFELLHDVFKQSFESTSFLHDCNVRMSKHNTSIAVTISKNLYIIFMHMKKIHIYICCIFQMKLSLALFAILAVIGLGQAHQFPDFGSGSLHEDLQDFLDLIPARRVARVFNYYLKHDPEIQDAVKHLQTSTLIKNFITEFQTIPEVLNLFNYLQKEGVKIYEVVNNINRIFGIKELEPPEMSLFDMPMPYRRTGGIRGFFREIKQLFNYDVFITTYAQKIKSSPAFVDFINQIKSDNFQQIVNKVYKIKSFQIILNGLKHSGVKVHIIADILLVVFGITVPNTPQERTLIEEFQDFYDLLPMEKFLEVMITYMNEDEQVRNAFLYMFTTEFHDLLRAVEALDEFKALVVYMQQSGLDMINGLKEFHKAIGMEDYIPPEIESLIDSSIGGLKIGDGMQGMLKDLYDLLPLDKIDVLYRLKLRTSKVFSEFIARMKSPELQIIVTKLYVNETYKNFIVQTREKGLDLHGLTKLANRIFGIKFPY
ncbi:hypothetical protein DMN91_000829 [Ooceraea biroi]|uniref:Protein G12 n=1 Tax=Ooceraea biroi TaxID=2015173 RepID=A0A3L8E2R5_OOCBI|nr:hypothetical protein DMN91_000829 [Ooceraea biroi]